MSTVSVREFAYNPSAMFARVEKGETIEVTRHGKVIAGLISAQRVPVEPDVHQHDRLRRNGANVGQPWHHDRLLLFF